MRLAILDDDTRVLEALQAALSDSYEVFVCEKLIELRDCIKTKNPDVLICDYDLGHETLENFLETKTNRAPVIIVTGKATKEVVIRLLNIGVSGLLEKPLSIADLKSCIQKVGVDILPTSDNVVGRLGFHIESGSREIVVSGERHSLTPIEFRILDFFLKNPDKKIKREEIEQHIWGDLSISKNTLDTHVGNLKKKIPVLSEKLISIYGAGFVLKISRDKA